LNHTQKTVFGLNLAIENDVEEDVAKFGYMLNIKVNIFKTSFFFYAMIFLQNWSIYGY
jgi:hypothetical protein